MRVLVTGGSGRLGKFVVADLIEHGFDVVSIDRQLIEAHSESLHYQQVDLMDVGQVAGAMQGCGAVIHLGAIPSPYRHPDEVVFANNTQSTFAVLQAARICGVKRAMIASSISAYGPSWSPIQFGPRYAPVDEEHPMENHDVYGLSKEIDERTAAMFCRLTGMQIAALRFHWVGLPEELQALQPDGRTATAEGGKNLWGYVDGRDAASACRRSIEADFGGFEAFNITAADTTSTVPTETLIWRLLPETELRSPIAGTGSGFTLSKAAEMLDWKPQYRWSEIE